MPTDLSQFKDSFVAEVEVNIQRLNENMLELEKDLTNHDILHNLMRFLHNIKGSSSMMQFSEMEFFSHVLESIIIDAIKGQISLNAEIIRDIYDSIDLLSASIQQIKEDKSSDLHGGVDDMNLLCVRFSKMVCDIALKEGKTVDFQMEGCEIEMDFCMMNRMTVPLIHILRNAITHGIRKEGIIKLTVRREENSTIVTIEDNGAGLDLKKLFNKGLSEGIICEDEAKNEEDPIVIEKLLFDPRISTCDEVSMISGRGVGLNAVKYFVETVNGTVRVERLKPGTRFVFELPLESGVCLGS